LEEKGGVMATQKILVIDDEPDFCSLVKEVLEITGKYKVIIATDGKNGVKAAHDHRPDLVLLDIMMPVINGFEVLKVLKQDAKLQSIPVIMLTARSDEDSRVKAAGLYNEDYLVKPVDVDTLRSTIEKILSIRM
jgi:DNA-binding response OmpR family regulator